MQELLEGIVEDARFEGAARQGGLDLLASALPEVRAHPGLLQRAIENVVRNALRHSPPGGVVRIEAGVTGNRLHLCIADQGPGVPEAALDRIFRPFFRGVGQASGDGYGLGLAIAERVIVAVDGRIRARNRDVGGLAVEIELAV